MSKIDYAFKSYVLTKHEDLVKQVNKASLLQYAKQQYYDNGVIMHAIRHCNDNDKDLVQLRAECLRNDLYPLFKEALKINKANYERTNRLKKRVSNMLLSGECLFLTLTFTDETLNNTSADTRRQYVRKYLKSCNCQYVANIDFGKQNHREHYHALVNVKAIDFDSWHCYGAILAERVRNRNIEKDKTRLSKYICKLSNHAIKETTQRSALIYSR